MSVWFEGVNEIECSIQQVKQSLENHGEHYVGVNRLMPGLTSVELVAQGIDYLTIRTNEGLMNRTNISRQIEVERVVVEFDEEYQTVSKMIVKSHYLEEFTTSGAGVRHRTVLSDVGAPGLLGFFYRNFGRSNIGNALLKANKSYFEQQQP